MGWLHDVTTRIKTPHIGDREPARRMIKITLPAGLPPWAPGPRLAAGNVTWYVVDG